LDFYNKLTLIFSDNESKTAHHNLNGQVRKAVDWSEDSFKIYKYDQTVPAFLYCTFYTTSNYYLHAMLYLEKVQSLVGVKLI
jgi:hypothetical protein